MPIVETPEITAQIQALETELGVEKSDRPEYQKLTDLQWHYVLTRCVRGIHLNRREWAKDTKTDESYIYKIQANDKVTMAMQCLTTAKGRLRLHELSDIAFDFAQKGNVQWAKLFVQMHTVKPGDSPPPAQTTIDWSGMGKGNADNANDNKELDTPTPELPN